MGNNRKLDRRLLWAMTIVGLLFVLYFRLVPFDADFSGGISAVLARFTWQPLSLKDIPLNLLILIPFSFGLAGLLYQSGRSWSHVTWITVLCVVAISAAIELFQVYIPERVPSLSDVITNGFSAILGVLSYRVVVYGFQRTLVRYATPTNMAVAFLVYGIFIALLTGYLNWSAGLSTWASDLPLTLGNENTDFRPWEGTISTVALLDRAVSAPEAAELLGGGDPLDTGANYDLTGSAPFMDQNGGLPPLNWQPDGLTNPASSPSGALVGSDHWLATGTAITPFNTGARAASAFTIAAGFESAREKQRGPARIISVSADSGHRNITLGQQDDALSIRLRTPSSGENGERPEMIVPGFFSTPKSRHVVLTYDAPLLSLYLDDPADSHAVSLAPGLALFQDFADSNRWLLEFPANPHLYDYRYWSLVIIPALLAAAILMGIRDVAIIRWGDDEKARD